MTVTDMFGNELKVGDTVCFTISMRIDQKPIVAATVGSFNCTGQRVWIILGEYRKSPDVEWATKENKLIKKVLSSRVVKCY